MFFFLIASILSFLLDLVALTPYGAKNGTEALQGLFYALILVRYRSLSRKRSVSGIARG